MAADDSIPDTVTTEILSRLPLKTLVRFRMACKLWESTICDPKFRYHSVSAFLFTVCNRVDRSLQFLVSPPGQVASDKSTIEAQGKLQLPDDYCFRVNELVNEVSALDYDDTIYPRYPTFECVNGLIIVENDDSVVVHNPTVRQSKILPPGDYPPPYITNIFGKRRVYKYYGKTVMHYDPVTKRYLCLRLQKVQSPQSSRIEGRFMDLEDTQWSKMPNLEYESGYENRQTCLHCSAYLNGSLYISAGTKGISLYKINLSSKTLDPVEKPFNLSYYVLSDLLAIYQGKLTITSRHMIYWYDRCLFTLEDVSGQSWTQVDFVADEETLTRIKGCEKRGITDNGEIILINRDLKMQNEIIYYNPINGNTRVSVAEVVGLAEGDFKNEFGDSHPRAVLHTDHVNHLMFLK